MWLYERERGGRRRGRPAAAERWGVVQRTPNTLPPPSHTTTQTQTHQHQHNNAGSNFYERLRDVREYHRRFPVDDVTGPEDDAAALSEEPRVPFTGEEGLGR